MGEYKIIVETTSSNQRAKEQFHFLKQNQIDSRLITLTFDRQKLYSVQAGPYFAKKEALEHVDKIKGLGIRHAFITSNTD
ncbi:SPOR domain-containing protein [Terrilactibacillus laevilacticus]|uniref:SPOR domain-containing protein n=1 Tax=Terrilactibacillus laevilacticus TaxID=1380157 RepID=A0ABW5PS97_9BACI|nr:SPOR domain-containing protein [Terrilactibacillus laevilacticus]